MKLVYLFKEALRGFSSAKLSTIASVITIMLSLVLMAVYFLFTINSSKLVKSLRDKVEIEAFLNDGIKNEDLNSLKDKIRAIGGVKSINYISKEEAAKIFEAEFGKGMLEIYDYNPLPASLKINLYDEYKTLERINKIKLTISAYPQVSDVQFPAKNLELIETKASGFLLLNLVIMIVITISSIFLVSNTIRLIINSRSRIIGTFKLLGGTKSFIMVPFLIEGFIQGLLGSLAAISVLYLFLSFFTSKFENSDFKIELLGTDTAAYIIAIGIILGIAGSYFSVKKYLKFQN